MSRPVIGAVAAAAVAVAVAAALRRGDPALGPTETVAAAGASVPTVALDPSGERGYVAWVAPRPGGGADVMVAEAAGGSPVRVNDLPGDAAPHDQAPAQVVAGAGGRVYLLWQNNTPVPGRQYPASDLRFSRSEDGGRSWSPAVTVNSDRGGPPSSHTFHDLEVAADGTLYASWIDGRVRDAARAAPGASAHHGHDGLPGSEIRVARSTDGGRTWQPEMIVDGDVCPCCRTSLAVGPDGSVYVAWRKVFAGEVRDVVVARLAPGASRFGEPVRVHADGWVFPGCPHAGPSVAASAGGEVHVAWYTGREGRQGLWRARAADASLRFGAPEALLTADWVPPSHVALAAGADGVLAAWDDRRAEDAAPRLVAGRGTPRSLGGPGRSPAVAAAAGRVLVAWRDGEAVRVREVR